MLPTIISIAFFPRLKRVRVKTRYIYRKLQCYLIHKWTKPIESTKQLHCLQSIRLLTAIKFVVVFFSFGAAMRNVCYLLVCVCVLLVSFVCLTRFLSFQWSLSLNELHSLNCALNFSQINLTLSKRFGYENPPIISFIEI